MNDENTDASVSSAPAWGWVKPKQVVQWAETEPLEYHRIMRGTARYRWWKPLVALLLGVIYYFTLSTVFTLAVLIPYFGITGGEFTQDSIVEFALPDTQQPISLLIGLGGIALMIPAGWLALISVGLGKPGRVWSVAAKIRWRLIFRSLLPACVALVIMNTVGIAIEVVLSTGTIDDVFGPPVHIDWGIALISIVILILLVPLQSAAEEFVFRGMMMQVLGAWIRSPWPAIVLPSVLFGFSHIYDIWGMLSVICMGLTMAWLVWRTGGLEAAVTLHIVNNWVAFGFMTAGVGGATEQTANGGGLGSLLGSMIGLIAYAWWMDRSCIQKREIRTRVDYVEKLVDA